MNRRQPIGIIGAGPAGAAAALTLLRSGFDQVTLFERHSWPRQKACAGGLGPRTIDWLVRADLAGPVLRDSYAVKGLHFTRPSGRSVPLSSPGVVARVMRRDRFDAFLVDRALAAGATFLPGTAITALERTRHGVQLSSATGSYECGAVLVATGSGASVKGVVRPPHRTLRSIMARYRDFPFDPGMMEMAFTARVAPYYAWLFPEPEGTVNIGLLADTGTEPRSLHTLFAEVFEGWLGPRLAQASLVGRRHGAPLQVCERVGRVAFERVLLVGESAGLVNAATGEGIPCALESGELAARCLAEHEGPWAVACAYQAAIERRFRLRTLAGVWLRRLVGSRLFGPLAALGSAGPAQRFASRILAGV